MIHRGITLAVFLVAVQAAPAQADGLIDYLGPREIAVGDSLRADARGVLATTLNPAGLGLTRELVFEGSYGHGFLDSAHSVTVSGCDSTVVIPGCFYYRYFRASPESAGVAAGERVHEGGATLAKAVTQRILFGVNIKYFDFESSVMDGEDASGFALDVGAIARLAEQVSAGVVGYHLLGTDASQYPMAVAAGLLIRPVMPLSVSFDALWNLEPGEGRSTGRYGGGAEYFFGLSDNQSGFVARLGSVHDVGASATYLSAGLGYLEEKVGIDIGARRQIRGGDELVIQASVRIFGPRNVPGTRQYR